jgi:hypothetical protein
MGALSRGVFARRSPSEATCGQKASQNAATAQQQTQPIADPFVLAPPS